MSNILLVGKYSVIEPLGLMFLAASLKAQGHRVGFHLVKDNAGDGWELLDKVWDKNQYVGFSVYTGFHKTLLRKAQVLRDEELKVIIGGPHATYFSESCKSKAHYTVVGEGLYAINEILAGRVQEGVIFVPDLVSAGNLPTPDREGLYGAYPEYASNRIKNVMASIGCNFLCNYCFNDSYHKLYPGNKMRQRTCDQVVAECVGLKEYPLELVYFQDDTFGFNMKWLKEFADSYWKEVGVPFHCQIRPEMATEERLELLLEAGCQGITMAIETCREDIRRNLLNRHMTNEDILGACHKIKTKGFKLRTEQMLGLPGTTFEDELDLLKMNVEVEPDLAWSSIFSPFLGTTLGDYCKENGLYEGNNDDLSEDFFSESKLNFDSVRLRKTNMLHKIFGTCVRFPNGHKLAEKFLEDPSPDFRSWFFQVKNHLFENCLYNTGVGNGQ